MDKKEFRKTITNMFIDEYLPEIKKEFSRFLLEGMEKEKLAMDISMIVGRSVAVKVGELKIAKPTGCLIDKMVKLYEENKKGENSK